MGPAPTSPQALHGWVLEASSCSFKSCRAETSIVRVLSWAKPCSALWDLCVVCTFLEKKYSYLDVAPEPLAVWHKELWGSFLEIPLTLRRKVSEHIPVFFVEKSLDLAMSGFFLSCGLEVVYLEEVFWVTCTFLKKKVHSLSVAPEPLAIWNKKLEGLESELFERTVYLSFCSPLAYIQVVLFRKNLDARSWHIFW